MEEKELISELKARRTISNAVFEDGLILDFSSQTQVNLLSFHKCEFKKGVQFKNFNSNQATLQFDECTFHSSLRLNNIKVFHFEIYKSNFGSINIGNLNCNEIDFREIFCLGIVNLYDVVAEKVLVINTLKLFKGKYRFNSKDIEELNIISHRKIEEIELVRGKNITIQGNVNKLNLFLDKFESINIDGYFKDDLNKDDLRKSKIQQLSYNNSNLEGNLIVSDTIIDQLNLYTITSSLGSIRLNEIEITNSCFVDCSIANFYWNQVSFINDPQIVGCDFSNLKMANVEWKNPKKLKNSFLDSKVKLFYGLRRRQLMLKEEAYSQGEISDLQYQRETYRQLKVSSISSHNKIDALLFYRNEMRLYWKEVRINGGISKQNRILVFLDRWTSDFGQNWILPLILLLCFHFVFVASIFNWELTLNWNNAEFGVGEYFILLNPVHTMPKYIDSGFEKIIDFLMRILGGYFIYHFIRAIRKYGRI